MRYLIMIPARGGSKGVKKKNIVEIAGKPMIWYTINFLVEIGCKYDVAVSSDSDEILSIAQKYSLNCENYYYIKRPSEFAKDTSSTEDVAFHTIEYMKAEYKKEYDAIITMAPNLPNRSFEQYKRCIKEFESMPSDFDSLVCFCRTDEDLWIRKQDNQYVRLNPNAPRRRQDREPYYVEKGSMTMTKIRSLYSTKSLWGQKVYGYELDEYQGIDVHDEKDVDYLRYLYTK